MNKTKETVDVTVNNIARYNLTNKQWEWRSIGYNKRIAMVSTIEYKPEEFKFMLYYEAFLNEEKDKETVQTAVDNAITAYINENTLILDEALTLINAGYDKDWALHDIHLGVVSYVLSLVDNIQIKRSDVITTGSCFFDFNLLDGFGLGAPQVKK